MRPQLDVEICLRTRSTAGHVPFVPNCAVADVTPAGTTVMCSTQSVSGTRDKVAKVLGVPAATVRVQYFEGAGTFGRCCYDDAAQAAATIRHTLGAVSRHFETR